MTEETDNSLIKKHYHIFGDSYNLSPLITLKRGGSCSLGGPKWTHDYLVYYKDQWTNQINLEADKDGAYIECNEGNISKSLNLKYTSGNIIDPIEMAKMIKYLENYAEILLSNYIKAQEYFKITKISGLSYYWINNTPNQAYAISSLSDGSIVLENIIFNPNHERSHIATYVNIDELIEKNPHLYNRYNMCHLL